MPSFQNHEPRSVTTELSDEQLRKRRRAQKILLILGIFSALSGYYIYQEFLIQYRDVTNRFEDATVSTWCLTKDVFILQDKAGEKFIWPARIDSSVPYTVDEYEKNPANWWSFPPYVNERHAGIATRNEILAGIRKNSSFKIIRVLETRNFEVGVTLRPIVVFDGTFAHLGELRAASLLSSSFDKTTLKMEAAQICRTIGTGVN